METLSEQIWNEVHRGVMLNHLGHGCYRRVELDEPVRIVAKVRHFGPGHFEAVVKEINLQRMLDRSDPNVPKGPRWSRLSDNSEDSERRSAARARQMVRARCLVLRVDRMLTFGTRAVLPWETFASHWKLFTQAYERASKRKFEYVGVPELHADGVHYHMHVAVSGWFQLRKALKLWHAICADDDPSYAVNGSINVKLFWSSRYREDPVGAIAGYISKYIGKGLRAEFNKKRYWASRGDKVEVTHRILRSRNWGEVQAELSRLYGISDWLPLLILRESHFFFFPEGRGFWFRVTPDMPLDPPPF